jgi:hypothetical protein
LARLVGDLLVYIITHGLVGVDLDDLSPVEKHFKAKKLSLPMRTLGICAVLDRFGVINNGQKSILLLVKGHYPVLCDTHEQCK